MAIRFSTSAVRFTTLVAVLGSLTLTACSSSQPKPATTSSANTSTLSVEDQKVEDLRQALIAYYPELSKQKPLNFLRDCDYLVANQQLLHCRVNDFTGWNKTPVIEAITKAAKNGTLIQVSETKQVERVLIKDASTLIPGTARTVYSTSGNNIYQVNADSYVEIVLNKLDYPNGITSDPGGSNQIKHTRMIVRKGEKFSVDVPVQISKNSSQKDFIQRENVVQVSPATLTLLKKSN